MYEATDLLIRKRRIDTSSGLILWQVACVGDIGYKYSGYDCRNLPILVGVLQKKYGTDHEVIIYEAAQYPVCEPLIRKVPLSKLVETGVSGISTLYIPPKQPAPLDMKMLRRLGLHPKTDSASTSRKRTNPVSQYDLPASGRK